MNPILLVEGEEEITSVLSIILGYLGSIFGSVLTMAESTLDVIVSDNLLLLFVLIPICGIGVGLFKRLISVN